MELSTIRQLDDWMTANCYNDSYGIGNRMIHEGYGLATLGSSFVWYYTERGVRDILQHFQTEQEAVAFACEAITADKSANRHMIGFLSDKDSERALLAELDQRSITYWNDKIPFGGPHDPRIRVFVFGCDVQKVQDLQQKYSYRLH